MDYCVAIKNMKTDRNKENRNKTASSKVVYILFHLYKHVLFRLGLKKFWIINVKSFSKPILNSCFVITSWKFRGGESVCSQVAHSLMEETDTG